MNSETPVYQGKKRECHFCGRSFEESEVIAISGQDELCFCQGGLNEVNMASQCTLGYTAKRGEFTTFDARIFRG